LKNIRDGLARQPVFMAVVDGSVVFHKVDHAIGSSCVGQTHDAAKILFRQGSYYCEVIASELASSM
jgi:hypothetical protein